MLSDDAQLLRRYGEAADQTAFAELVGRHLGLVYPAALRQTRGDSHRAQEVTQMVFIALARKAAALARHPALPAWLHRTTRLAAAELVRKEARRTAHERAVPPSPDSAEPPATDWRQVRPLLDASVQELGERDRTAIVLRFFSGQSYAAVGRALSLSENAARMRVERALDKLRARLARHGITSSAAALSAWLATESAAAASLAPAALAAAVAAAAGTPSAAALSSAGVIAFMSTNKLALAAAALVAAAGTTLVVKQQLAIHALEAESAALQSAAADADSARAAHRRLSALSAETQRVQAEMQGMPALAARMTALRKDVDRLREQLAARARGNKAASPGPVYDVGALDQMPRPTFQTPPKYPPAARQAGKSGQAMVDMVVDQGGFVRNAYILSSTDPAFEQPTLDAVQQWAFSPGAKGGQSVNVHLQVPIVYSLNPEAPPAASAGPTDWFPNKS